MDFSSKEKSLAHNKMLYFTTYFDRQYLSRALVMYNSLQMYNDNFLLYVLCLDDFTADFFIGNKDRYPNIQVIRRAELENSDTELRDSKQNRSVIEYYFTLSPCLPLYILEKYKPEHICSLDADILFLSDPAPLFQKLHKASVVVTPHKFSDELKEKERYGIFNVSFQIFKNDETGLGCLKTWRHQCIEWCGDYVDEKNNRFADQKYLDEWPGRYGDKLAVLNDNVAGLAPWNVNRYTLSYEQDHLMSNGERVIFFHFHGFKFFSHSWAANGFNGYRVKRSEPLRRLYSSYWELVNANDRQYNLSGSGSVRYDLQSDIADKILNADGVYYKTGRGKAIEMNFSKLPGKVKGGLKRIYGLFN